MIKNVICKEDSIEIDGNNIELTRPVVYSIGLYKDNGCSVWCVKYAEKLARLRGIDFDDLYYGDKIYLKKDNVITGTISEREVKEIMPVYRKFVGVSGEKLDKPKLISLETTLNALNLLGVGAIINKEIDERSLETYRGLEISLSGDYSVHFLRTIQ